MRRHRGNRNANRIGEEEVLTHQEDDLFDVDREDRHEQELKIGFSNPRAFSDSDFPCQGEGRKIGLLGHSSPEPSVLDAVMAAEEDLKTFGISF